jgi:hypothetical protein
MSRTTFTLLMLVLAVPATACGPAGDCAACDCGPAADDAATPEDGGDVEEEADAAACEPADAATPFPELYAAVLERLTTEIPVNEGDWAEDFGDATAFAPPALLSVGRRTCDERLIGLAVRTLEHQEFLVRHFLEVLEGPGAAEVLVGGIGLIESYRLGGDARWAAAADELLRLLLDTAALFGDYLYGPLLDVEPYGPTAVTGIVAAEALRYVEVVDPTDDARLARALELAAAIDRVAWDAAGGFYRAAPDEPALDLYPNVAMTIVWTLAHRLTGDPEHLARAEALYDAIQPLRLAFADAAAYHSLYSSSVPDYVSLSSQNYLVFALRFLDEETRDPRYLAEARSILSFVESHLYWHGMAWHHWENDARATWYCTGCNFQLLYDLWLLAG